MSAIAWNASASREVTALSRPKLEEVRKGIFLAVVGCLFFVGLSASSLVLLGPTRTELAVAIGVEEKILTWVGLGVLGLGLFLGLILLLAGQWRCLKSSPQGHGAKELLFSGMLCSLTAPLCLVAAHFLGGDANYQALEQLPTGLADLRFGHEGGVLQATALGLALLSLLLLSAFTRAIAGYLRDDSQARSVAGFYWFIAFLFGGTFGVFLNAVDINAQGIWLAVILGWLLGVLWLALLLHGVSRSLHRTISRLRSRGVRPLQPVGHEQGQVRLQASQYLHRTKEDNEW